MKRITYYLPLVFLITCCLGCKKDNDGNPANAIFGQWLFIDSRGGFTGHDVITAKGKNVYAFYKDSTYKTFRNDTLVKNGKFHIGSVQSIFTGTAAHSINFDSNNEQSTFLISIKNDSLYLTDNHVEPYGASYIRIK